MPRKRKVMIRILAAACACAVIAGAASFGIGDEHLTDNATGNTVLSGAVETSTGDNTEGLTEAAVNFCYLAASDETVIETADLQSASEDSSPTQNEEDSDSELMASSSESAAAKGAEKATDDAEKGVDGQRTREESSESEKAADEQQREKDISAPEKAANEQQTEEDSSASAEDTEGGKSEQTDPDDGRTTLALHEDGGNEQFSGNEFYVRGQNIQSVTLQLDRDGFYLVTDEKTVSQSELPGILESLLENQGSELFYAITSDNKDADDPVFTVKEKKHASQEVTLSGSGLGSQAIGFYIPPSFTESIASSGDPQADFHAFTDYMNNARMTLSVTYVNGAQETQTYKLTTGKLKVSYDENGMNVSNEFVTSDDEPYVYGILLTKQS